MAEKKVWLIYMVSFPSSFLTFIKSLNSLGIAILTNFRNGMLTLCLLTTKSVNYLKIADLKTRVFLLILFLDVGTWAILVFPKNGST